jgi:hypothetical protein
VGYRHGFNTQERSSELAPDHFTAEFWEYDARIGRRWNVDPRPVVGVSEYAALGNSPIWASDVRGDSILIYGSDEFKAKYALDRANLMQTKEGKALFQYLENDCNCQVNITEATSLIGDLKNLWEEGSGD